MGWTSAGRVGPGEMRRGRWLVVLVATALALSACGLHVSKNGVSGNVFGHKFSAAKGQLPAGFPAAVPVPDASRVLGGAEVDNKWDVGFAVTGTITTGTTAYQAKLHAAGYTISNVETGSTTVTTGANSPSSNFAGSVFTATNPQWTVQVESGSTSSVTNGVLKAGEFAINITVVPKGAAQG